MADLERERDFYRRQSDELGTQVLRLKEELTAARKEARRNRTTATVVRALYQLASEGLSREQLSRRFLAILLDGVSVDGAAIVHYEPAAGELRVDHQLGFPPALVQAPLLRALAREPGAGPAGEGSAGLLAQLRAATGLESLLWAYDPGAHVGLLLGNPVATRLVCPAFDAGDQQTVEAALGVYLSVCELKQTEDALRTSEANYRAIFDNVNDAIAVTEIAQGRILDANEKMGEMFGYVPEALRGLPIDQLCMAGLPFPPEKARRYAYRALRGEPQLLEWQLQRHNGERFWAEINLKRALIGSRLRLLAVVRDISERKRVEEQLRHDALHDALTGLPNRALILDRVAHGLEKVQREGDYLFAVLFLDLDRFKVINDSLGHTVGDQLLTAIAQRLSACIRPGDTVARLGGDEFLVLLDDLQQIEHAVWFAERLHQAFKQSFQVSGHDVFTSASIGIALSNGGYHRAEDMLRDADIAMYQAKARGKALHEVFDPAMHHRAVALLRVESELRRAVEREEFRVYYQPIIELAQERTVGFEALVRWQHPERGLVFPGEFIPVAEDSGLILGIGRLVLQQVCRDVRTWERRRVPLPAFTVSVNLSRKQISRAGLVAEVAGILHETGCDPHRLRLEITESAIMDNALVAKATLEGLHALSIPLGMDDFGTGYSSLNYLHQFPIDHLKIDRSFIQQMDSEVDGVQIVSTIISLGHNLGMRVVAEGLETRAQVDRVKALGCDFGQGYYFARPVDEPTAVTMLLGDLRPAAN